MRVKPISAVAGLASIAAVGFLAIFLVRQTNAPQLSEMSQPAANATAAPIESQAPARDNGALRKPDAPREVRRKHGNTQSALFKNGWLPLAVNPAPLDYTVAVPEVSTSTTTIKELADSFVPVSEPGKTIDDQSALVSTHVPAESYVSTHQSGRASMLLAEIQRESAALSSQAEVLGTYARNPQRHWKSHAFYLDRVKGHINAVGERTAQLQQIRDSVLPWQRQAIAEVTAHATQVANSTQAAIVHLRENRDRLHFSSEYRGHLMTIEDRSEDMKQTVDKFLDYEETQQKLQQLRNELELSGD